MPRRFLYFLPNVTGCPDAKKLRAFGLDHAFPKAPACGDIGNGPGGESGVMLAYGDGEDMGFKATEQHWIRMSTGAWLGKWLDPAKQPAPADLRREDSDMEGYAIVLGDHNEWLVPVLRFVNGDTKFPRVLCVGDDGNAQYIVRDEFRAIYNLSDRMMAASLQGKGRDFSPNDHMQLAVEALKLHYRVGPYEISLLALIDSENIKKIADAALDGPNLRALIEELKKKAADA